MPTEEPAGVPTEESAPAGQQAPRVPVADQPAAGPPVAGLQAAEGAWWTRGAVPRRLVAG